ncbi:MAG: hypothetical protein ACOC2F_03205 [Bacteroidota bacterium]
MLQILINNTPLDLREDTEIRVEENFPYFDTDAMPASTVFHFDIPVTPHNEHLFNYANYVMVRKKYRTYNSRINVHGVPVGSGKLILTNSKPDSFRISIVLNDFGVEFEGVKINSTEKSFFLGFKGSSQSEKLQTIKEINNDEVDAPFKFPKIYAPNFYGDDDENGNPENNENYQRYINNYTSGDFIINEEDFVSKNTLVPFVKVSSLIDDLLNEKKWNISGNLLDDDFFKSLIIHNNRSLDKPFNEFLAMAGIFELQNISFPEKGPGATEKLIWDSVSKDETEQFLEHYVAPETADYIVIGAVDITTKDTMFYQVANDAYVTITLEILSEDTVVHSITKTISNPGTIEEIEETFSFFEDDIQVFANEGEKIWTRFKLDDYSPSYMEDKVWFSIDDTSFFNVRKDTPRLNDHEDVVHLKNHLPEMDFTKFLNTIRNAFGCVMFFDSSKKQIEIKTINSVLDDFHNAYDITPYSVMGRDENNFLDKESLVYSFKEKAEVPKKIKYEVNYGFELSKRIKAKEIYGYARKEMAFYVSHLDETTGQLEWNYHSHFYKKSRDQETQKDKEVSLEFSPCRMASFDKNFNRISTISYYDDEGISPYNEDEPDMMQLVLSAYIGIRNTLAYGDPFPFTTSVKNVTGSKTLNFNSQDSLDYYINRWASFFEYKEELTVELSDISIWEMLEIIEMNRPTRTDAQPRWVRYKGTHWLPKQASFIININGQVKESEIVIVKNREE